MTSSVASVAGGLLGLAGIGGIAAVGTALVRRTRPCLPGGLAVALDGPTDPLGSALRLGYTGIEVGVRLDGNVVRLTGTAHAGDPGATLDRLVVSRLAELVRPTVHGRVYPLRVEPFLLLVRLEWTATEAVGEATYRALDTLLREHASVFTRCVDGRVVNAAVTVVLCGPKWPRQIVADAYERYAFVDCTFADLETLGRDALPVSLAPLVSEPLTGRLGWDPHEEWTEFPAEARHVLRWLVLAAHADGRLVRFVDVPDGPRRVRVAFWRELRAAGVDLIGSRRLLLLSRFLRRSRFRTHKHRAVAARAGAGGMSISR